MLNTVYTQVSVHRQVSIWVSSLCLFIYTGLMRLLSPLYCSWESMKASIHGVGRLHAITITSHISNTCPPCVIHHLHVNVNCRGVTHSPSPRGSDVTMSCDFMSRDVASGFSPEEGCSLPSLCAPCSKDCTAEGMKE